MTTKTNMSRTRGFRLGMLFNAIQRLLESETGKPISGSLAENNRTACQFPPIIRATLRERQ